MYQTMDDLITVEQKRHRQLQLNRTVRNWRWWVMLPFICAWFIPLLFLSLIAHVGIFIRFLGDGGQSVIAWLLRPFINWTNRGVKE